MRIGLSKTDAFLNFLLGGLLVALVVCIGILSWVPPVSRDALTHHLLVPKIYLQFGKIVELPHIGFSYYPMNLDLLYILPLYFGNDILPKFIHFTFGLLTAGLLFRFLKRRFGTFLRPVRGSDVFVNTRCHQTVHHRLCRPRPCFFYHGVAVVPDKMA